ncbi:PKD domain-containing protein [Tunicatimonas pelagia]|uniref:PKD domain-containing protein n=1 Tax=Tunicatimonas pelagia TaxID=931531 RepID=UPI0026659C85|nr:PKD domain-containing protein [Tunicatimonas pelagia]WKN40696.1 PKD domain-containing protein [Tunicatimonas pelagia]
MKNQYVMQCMIGLASMIVWACQDDDPAIGYPDPVADFKPGVTTSFAGNPVLFPHELSEEATYYWNFGDGTQDTTHGWAPTHTYTQAGKYEVTLTVVRRDARDDTIKTIVVLPPFPQILAGETCKVWKLMKRYERKNADAPFQNIPLDSLDQNTHITFCADGSANDQNWYRGIDDNFRKWEYYHQKPQYTSLDVVTKLYSTSYVVDVQDGNLVFGDGSIHTSRWLWVFMEE